MIFPFTGMLSQSQSSGPVAREFLNMNSMTIGNTSGFNVYETLTGTSIGNSASIGSNIGSTIGSSIGNNASIGSTSTIGSTTATSNSTFNSPLVVPPLPDPISTIFIIGFPEDFKERELVNMFMFASGFEGAVLKPNHSSPATDDTLFSHSFKRASSINNTGQLIGFVKFSSVAAASHALQVINGKILDPERGLILKAEFAKKNLILKGSHAPVSEPRNITAEMAAIGALRSMTISVPGQPDPAVVSVPFVAPIEEHSVQTTTETDEEHNPITSTTAMPIPIPQPVPLSNQIVSEMTPPALPITPTSLSTSTTTNPPSISLSELNALQRSLIATGNLGRLAAVVGENFPCNTLYVGNLPPSASEEELRSLFKHCFGYRRLSFRPKASGPMCFVEFEDIACATAALETLYGTMLSCSLPAKGGIRLSFSKNPLGLRVASPICDVSVLGNVHAINTMINIGGLVKNSTSSSSISNSSISNPSSSSSFSSSLPSSTGGPPVLHEIQEHRTAISTIMAHFCRQKPPK